MIPLMAAVLVVQQAVLKAVVQQAVSAHKLDQTVIAAVMKEGNL
jgi:hypothetical protein